MPELLDGPLDAPDELAANLADIAFTNRRLGGFAPIRRAVRGYAPATVVDVACGGADLVPLLIADAARHGRMLFATCVDHQPDILALARRRTGGDPRITFVLADATRLPFADGAFDVATCTLALHHFEPNEAVELLRELRRIARSPVVGDLVRSPLAFAATAAYARVFGHSSLTRHDAPLSVRRAYTPGEARDLARAAGWRKPWVRREPFFRMTLLDG
jgi:SAM-dependent methyltransferase